MDFDCPQLYLYPEMLRNFGSIGGNVLNSNGCVSGFCPVYELSYSSAMLPRVMRRMQPVD